MSADLIQFRKDARAWLESHVPAEKAPMDGQAAREYALAWQKTQYEGGWAGLSWPKEAGGRGLSVTELIIWYEEYARAGAPKSLDPLFVALNHAGPTINACGSEEQKAFHLPRILRGESLWCQGFSEPNSGSDLGSLRMRGRVEGDELVLEGQKIWSSYADMAEWQELLIRTDADAKTGQALSWVICPMDSPGITVRPILTMAGAYKYCEIFYDNVRIPLANVVGGLNNGWATAMSTLAFERGTAALGLLINLVMQIDQMWQDCLSSRPAMKQRLGLLRAEVAAVRATAYRVALDSESGVPDTSGSIVRLSFSEITQRAMAAAIDLYGFDAPEVLGDHGYGHEYLDAFSETIAGGTSEVQRNIIGERMLGLPRGPR